jgi:hypothetical protein
MTDVTAGRLVSTSPMPIKGGDKSTGFVLKLYQMVNGAPDDILSVSCVLAHIYDDVVGWLWQGAFEPMLSFSCCTFSSISLL